MTEGGSQGRGILRRTGYISRGFVRGEVGTDLELLLSHVTV